MLFRVNSAKCIEPLQVYTGFLTGFQVGRIFVVENPLSALKGCANSPVCSLDLQCAGPLSPTFGALQRVLDDSHK